ncbi:CD59 glycoprotein-like [Montipora capricornis]|uniref:CD59 glycoprotein-like n=1 Tax=Montipora capricornis TaxID=246305 RepID=UPI0035F1CB29
MAKSLSSFDRFTGILMIVLLPKGFSLECHTCYSENSWDDCLENSWVEQCSNDFDACLMVFTSKLHRNGQQLHEFAKTCWLLEKCHEKKCRKEITDPKQYGNITANYCDHQCCTENLCNTGMLVSNASESLP